MTSPSKLEESCASNASVPKALQFDSPIRRSESCHQANKRKLLISERLPIKSRQVIIRAYPERVDGI